VSWWVSGKVIECKPIIFNTLRLVSLSGVPGIIGNLVTGILIDRFRARWAGGITLASTAIAYPLLVEPLATPTLIVIGMMISGYAAGTKLQLCSHLTSRYAGGATTARSPVS
jgi:predicted MFS family arabinose efflux permease